MFNVDSWLNQTKDNFEHRQHLRRDWWGTSKQGAQIGVDNGWLRKTGRIEAFFHRAVDVRIRRFDKKKYTVDI